MDKKKKRGRPTEIDNDTLIRLARDAQFVLEQNWGRVGECLHRSRTESDIRAAFSHISQPGNHRLDRFTSSDTRKATLEAVRRMRKKARALITLLYEASVAQRKAQSSCEDAERNSVLEKDLARRRELEIALKKFNEEFAVATQRLSKLQERQIKLNEALSQAEAYTAQTELLRFIKSRRQVITPFNIASAMAGIPILSARISSHRVRTLVRKPVKGQEYEIFEVIARFFSDRSEELETSTSRIRDFLIRKRRKPEPHIEEMRRNWYFIECAVRAASHQTDIRRGYFHYRVFDEYMKRTITQRPGDAVLAELKKLDVDG